MKVRKTYRNINPTLLYDEVKEFALKHGLTLDQNTLETYSMPTDSSAFIYRGTLSFRVQGREALVAYITGVDKGETRVLLESVDELFPEEKVRALESDLEFMLGPYEPEE